MSEGTTKRGTGAVARLLAGTLVTLALLILVAAGIYSRPSTVSAAAKETGEIISRTASEFVAEPLAAIDSRSSRKTRQQEPAPPPAAPVIASPPSPPSIVSTASPASPPSQPSTASPASPLSPPSASTPVSQPAPPTQPTAPAVKQEKTEKQKDKSSKEKSKDKVVNGELIEAPQPVYPEEAKKQKVEGRVVVAIVIGDDGNVISAKAKSGPEPLHGAAETAASKARFKPTTVNGKPAKVAGAMTYNFVLDKK